MTSPSRSPSASPRCTPRWRPTRPTSPWAPSPANRPSWRPARQPASPPSGPSCPTRNCSTCTEPPPPCTPRPGAERRSWCSTGAPGARTAISPCRPTRRSCSPQLTERGIPLVAISPQKPDGSLTMQQKHGLAFAVVSDPGNTIARRLGILTRPSPQARAAQLQLGLDLTGVNADGTVPCRCPPPSPSTPAAPSGGSTSTPTTAPVPNPSRSSMPSTTSSTKGSGRLAAQRSASKVITAQRIDWA